MRLTPLDIREQQFRRVMRGLDPEEVVTFLATVAVEFEQLVTGQNEMRQRVVELEDKIQEYRSMEKALRDTLLTAERVMGDAKESAQREATLIIREAEVAAQRSKGRLQQELSQLHHEIGEVRRAKDAYLTRVRWLLRSHLEMVEGHGSEFAEMDQELGMMPSPPPQASTAPLPPPPVYSTLPSGPSATLTPPAPASSVYATRDDLGDALRPIAPDGTYAAPGLGAVTPAYSAPAVPPANAPATPAPNVSSSAEELTRAARRAERLAAEARAALERHSSGSQNPAGAWSVDRFRDDPGSRP